MKNEKLVRENRSQWGKIPGEEGVTRLLDCLEDEDEEWIHLRTLWLSIGSPLAQENILL